MAPFAIVDMNCISLLIVLAHDSQSMWATMVRKLGGDDDRVVRTVFNCGDETQ
jgi:hypothetical protein